MSLFKILMWTQVLMIDKNKVLNWLIQDIDNATRLLKHIQCQQCYTAARLNTFSNFDP